MKNIVFVDDEPHVLDGLRRMLYAYRSEWSMRFAASGLDALRLLAEAPCDVIVTDMRMPGLSGAELLSRVSQEYPEIIRIVLSGMCDREQSLVSASSAHQFLPKPCDPSALKNAVDRALAMHATLEHGAVKSFISRLTSLPSMPVTYTELVKAAADPEASVRQLGSIVGKDLAMTSKVLHLVNSSLFGLRRPVIDPSEACIYLGVESIKALVLSLGVFSQYRRVGVFSVEALQTHSLRTAAFAKEIAVAERMSKSAVDEVFLAGMLHDVGKLVLAMNLSKEYDECMNRASAEKLPMFDSEFRTFGITHAEVGQYLLRLWGLPDVVTDAVAFHHRLPESAGRVLGPLAIVHVANAMIARQEQRPAPDIDLSCMSLLGSMSKPQEWQQLGTLDPAGSTA